MLSDIADGLKAVSDTYSSMRRYKEERNQQWKAAENQRTHPGASGRSNKQLEYIYDSAHRNRLNLNLHDFNPLDDATLYRECMRIDTKYQYYLVGPSDLSLKSPHLKIII